MVVFASVNFGGDLLLRDHYQLKHRGRRLVRGHRHAAIYS